MAPSNRRIPSFGAVPDNVEVIDIDNLPDFHGMIHAVCDEDIKVEIKTEPTSESSASTLMAGLGNNMLRPKQAAPPSKPVDLETQNTEQQALFAQFFASHENQGSEQGSENSQESEDQMQNPIEQETQYLKDKATFEQKQRAGEVTQQDELEFMRKESAYTKSKRDLAALMEDEEDETLLFEPPEVNSESGRNNIMQSNSRPEKRARTSKSQSRNGITRASKLRQSATLNLRGHTNFWENAEAAEQMETEPDYMTIEKGQGGRTAALTAFKKRHFDKQRLKTAASSFTNTKGVAKRTKGFGMDDQGWTLSGMFTPLKNYQIINCGWMRRQEMRASAPRGGILADQMGLGKTVTCLANIVNGRPLKSYPRHLQPTSHTTLIVVPSSLLGQWRNEIRLHTKQEFSRRKRGIGLISVFKDSESEQHKPMDFESQDIILTTYHDVRSSWPACEIPEGLSETERHEFFMDNIYDKRGPLHKYQFLRIVLDEGHVIANPETQIAKACFNLVADHKWVLTGTPMVNGSKDLYSLLSFIEHPTVINMKFESFKSRFCNIRDPMSLDALSQEMVDSVACFTHKDKLFDARLITLPKPHNRSMKINPTKLEIEIYNIVRHRFKERAQTVDENGEPKSNKFHVWAMFTLLRQLTAHPLLVPMRVCDYLEPEDFVKLEKAVERQTASKELPISTIHAFKELMKRQQKQVRARKENGIELDMRKSAPIDELDEGLDDVEEVWAPDIIKKNKSKKGTGQSHGKNVAYGGYIESFKRSANYHINSERTICCKCKRPNDNPVMTSCYHFYCRTHMEDLMHEAARIEQYYAICVKEGCGKQITRQDIIDPEIAMKPKYLDADGNVLPSTKTLAIKAQVLNWIDPKSGGDPNAKIIIFCQWKTFLRLLSQICETENWDYVTLHGSMTKKTRDANIDKFKNVAGIKIMIATLKTGGVGLNLTCARYVLNVEPYWNSAGEIQAFSRVYRIGQEQETEFVNLTLAGTVDEHLNSIKERKKKEIDQVTAGHKRLTMEDLLKTFEPTVEEKSSEESASE